MSSTATKHYVQVPQPGELCDVGEPAIALVAVLYPNKEGKIGRLVFCGHHFDALASEVKAKCIAVHDSRLFVLPEGATNA